MLRRVVLGALGGLVVAVVALIPLVGASAMEFRLVQLKDPRCGNGCPPMIAGEGEIDRGTTAKFVSFARVAMRRGAVSQLVLLDSPGGYLLESLQFGILLRQLGAAVMVARMTPAGITSGRCFSACVYSFMGGRYRIAPPGSRLGVHRAFMDEEGYRRELVTRGNRTPPALAQAMRRYARLMGVDPRVIALAERTPSTSIHEFRRGELTRLRLAPLR